MSVWAAILFGLIAVAIIFYLLVGVFGIRSDKILGPPLGIAVAVVLFAVVSFQLFSEKSIYVVITSAENELYKSVVEFNDDVWQHAEYFSYSSETRGIHAIDFRKQVEELVGSAEQSLCKTYESTSQGSGRYEQKEEKIQVCVNKKGMRWNF